MHYGNRNPEFSYSMNPDDPEDKMETTKEEKDLGVTFTKDLKFSNHIARAANKGNRVTGAIRRAFRYMDKDMFSQLYKALIRGHLEYANTVWNPIKKGDADHLEKVQRRATKLVPEIRDLPYAERLRVLKLPSLRYRRERGDMLYTYKILHGLVDITPDSLLHLAPEGSTRGHSLKIQKPRCRTALRQHFFSLRVIENWNNLPEGVVTAPSLNACKGRLDRHWIDRHYLF